MVRLSWEDSKTQSDTCWWIHCGKTVQRTVLERPVVVRLVDEGETRTRIRSNSLAWSVVPEGLAWSE
jgi:hypothetical protein